MLRNQNKLHEILNIKKENGVFFIRITFKIKGDNYNYLPKSSVPMKIGQICEIDPGQCSDSNEKRLIICKWTCKNVYNVAHF
jgi:hypothetical protein